MNSIRLPMLEVGMGTTKRGWLINIIIRSEMGSNVSKAMGLGELSVKKLNYVWDGGLITLCY